MEVDPVPPPAGGDAGAPAGGAASSTAPTELAQLLYEYRLPDDVVPPAEKAALADKVLAHIERYCACTRPGWGRVDPVARAAPGGRRHGRVRRPNAR